MEIWQHINCPPVPTKYEISFSKKLVFLKNWLCTASKSDDTNDNPACKRMYLCQSIQPSLLSLKGNFVRGSCKRSDKKKRLTVVFLLRNYPCPAL